MEKALKYRAYAGVIALAFVVLGIWGAVFAESKSGVLTVAVLDVGQGDSIYIESPTGVEIVIDGGPGASILEELPKAMGIFDRSIEGIVATHPDADHIGGYIDLLQRYRVKIFIEPGIEKDTLTATRLREEVEERDIRRVFAERGMALDIGGGARLEVLFPDFDVSALSGDDSNEGGIVMQLVYGSSTMLLMADVPANVEKYLLELDASRLDSDILKVGHHGSRTSTLPDFVRAVSPDIAVISVGAKNRYGHPTEEVLETLEAFGVETLRTDEKGTIIFESKGGEFVQIR